MDTGNHTPGIGQRQRYDFQYPYDFEVPVPQKMQELQRRLNRPVLEAVNLRDVARIINLAHCVRGTYSTVMGSCGRAGCCQIYRANNETVERILGKFNRPHRIAALTTPHISDQRSYNSFYERLALPPDQLLLKEEVPSLLLRDFVQSMSRWSVEAARPFLESVPHDEKDSQFILKQMQMEYQNKRRK